MPPIYSTLSSIISQSLGTYFSLTLSTSDIGVCRTIHDHVPLKVVDDPIPDYRTHQMDSSTIDLKNACIFGAALQPS